jgi:riboflavin transporter FmnP
MKKTDIQKYATLAMLSALAYISLFLIHFPIIPSASFLSCDVKDVMLVIGAFIFGPLSGFLMALVVSLIQMFTISGQFGAIGLAMNVLSSTAFVCPAAIIYRKKNSTAGAALGLAIGCVSMTAVMLLWNYIMTPIYMNVPRDTVKDMLIPVFLPFNLIKSIINAVIAFILYKVVAERLHQYFTKGGKT